jgi:hypothetical protein
MIRISFLCIQSDHSKERTLDQFASKSSEIFGLGIGLGISFGLLKPKYEGNIFKLFSFLKKIKIENKK